MEHSPTAMERFLHDADSEAELSHRNSVKREVSFAHKLVK